MLALCTSYSSQSIVTTNPMKCEANLLTTYLLGPRYRIMLPLNSTVHSTKVVMMVDPTGMIIR